MNPPNAASPMRCKPLLRSLRVRLAAFVVIVIAPILALMLVTHGKYRRHEIERAGADALQLARVASEHHDRLVDGARQMLAGLARLPEVRGGNLQRCDEIFAEIQRDNPGYGLIMQMDPQGGILSPASLAGGSAGQPRANVGDQPWFRPLRDGPGFTIGGYQWCPVSKDMVLLCGQPLMDDNARRDEGAQTRTVLSVSLRTDWLTRFAQAANLPPGSTLTVIGRDGNIWARYPDGPQWVGRSVPEAALVRDVAQPAGVMEAQDESGDGHVCAYARLANASLGSSAAPEKSVYVLVSMPRSAVVGPGKWALGAELIVLAMVTLAMLLAAALGSRLWVFRWTDQLAAATQRVANGDLSARSELRGGPSEFRRLGESFDEMAAAVERAAARSTAAEADLRRSGDHLRNVLNSMFTFVAVLTPDGVLTEVNQAALAAVGVEAKDVLGKPFEDTPWWAKSAHERARLREAVARAARGEALRYDTTPRVGADGAPIFIDTLIAPMFDQPRGRVTHLVVSGIDVTEKRRAEQALRESEERLSLAIRTAGLGTWDADVHSGRALWSEQTFRLLDHEPTPDGAASIDMWRCRVHPDDIERVERATDIAMRDQSYFSPEYRIIRRDGEVRWLCSAGRFIYHHGRAVRFIGVVQCISARKRAEEEIARLNADLHRRVAELQTLLEVMPVGIGIARDRLCARIDVNAAFARLLGLPAAANASLGAPLGERPEHFSCWRGDRKLTPDELPLQVAARTGVVVRDVELEVRHDDGRVTHLLEYAAPLLDSHGERHGAVGAFIDISERKKADAERQALMEQANSERAEFEAVLRQMPAGVIIAEPGADAPWGRIVLRNEQVERIWGPGDANQEPKPIGFHADGRQYEPHEWPLSRSLATGERVSGEEIEIERRDGTRAHISVTAGPIRDGNGNIVAGVLTFYDITERKLAQGVARKQQAELVHLSRLSTMGQMAAGFAHELNQPLGAILNYAGVCLDRVQAQDGAADAKVVRALEEVAGETRRAGEIIRRLRGFARKEKPNVTPTEINHLVREAVAMVSAEMHYAGVRVEFDLCDSLPAALADGVQIEQVIVNLVRNAIDAMRDTDPPLRRLTVRTECVRESDHNNGDDCDVARISVIDAGCGIPPDVRARIFDSFFTTKPDGLGMGLPICQSIIQGHGGNLGVTSNDSGSGTIVHFTLPLAAQLEEAVP